MGYRNHLTGEYITFAPKDKWAIILDYDNEYVAVRYGYAAVMTRGCLDPDIATASDVNAVCDIVLRWHDTHPNDVRYDRERIRQYQHWLKAKRQDEIAEDLALQKRIERFRAAGSELSLTDIAAGLTCDEIDREKKWIRGCEMNDREKQYTSLTHKYAKDIEWASVVNLPSGREVRQVGDKWEVQPPNDNYWVAFDDLIEAIKFSKGEKTVETIED